jgi:alpha-L-rhamnosidase
MAVASIRPSLGYMIDHGATTLWELWDSDAPTSRMSSLDHTMLSGDLLVWLYQHVTGIGAAAPGFARALIAPRPIPTLAWARASYDAMPGRIESGWRREAGRIVYDITLPPNVEGTLSLPTETAAALQPGRHRFVR